jgi:sensor c-di-GMP phosphodiesterase-like protein
MIQRFRASKARERQTRFAKARSDDIERIRQECRSAGSRASRFGLRQASRRASRRAEAVPPPERLVREADYAEERSTQGASALWVSLEASRQLPRQNAATPSSSLSITLNYQKSPDIRCAGRPDRIRGVK